MTLTADATFWAVPADWAPGSIIRLSDEQHLVLGDTGHWYVVGKSCSCPFWQKRLAGTGQACKHMHHLDEFLHLPLCPVCRGKGCYGPHSYASDGNRLLRCVECNGLGRVAPTPDSPLPSEEELLAVFR